MESAGIPTVVIAIEAYVGAIESLGVARLLITPHAMGRTVGPAFDRKRQRAVVAKALTMLATATEPVIETMEPLT